MINKETYKLGQGSDGMLPVGVKTPTGRVRKIEVDEWLGYEDEKLSSPLAKKNPYAAMTAILQRLVQSIGDDDNPILKKSSPYVLCEERHVVDMAEADRQYILLKALAASADGPTTVIFKCTECGVDLEDDIMLADLDVYPVEEDSDLTVKIELPGGIRDADGNVYRNAVYTLPTGSKMAQTSKYAKEGEHAIASAIFAACIKVDGKSFSVETYRRMRKRDRDALLKALGEISPGVDLSIKCNCNACGEEIEAHVDVSQFFRPS